MLRADPSEHLLSQRIALQVEQVTRAVETKAIVFDGHRMPTGHPELLEDSTRHASLAELNRGAHAGQTGT